MNSFETFYREAPLETSRETLPGRIYNLAHVLLQRSGRDCLFVPIRSIQYMAVIDQEEIIFVDIQAKHLVELAWQAFQPQARQSLGEPVPYTRAIYIAKGRQILDRLQGEFSKALEEMEKRHLSRQDFESDADVVPINNKKN